MSWLRGTGADIETFRLSDPSLYRLLEQENDASWADLPDEEPAFEDPDSRARRGRPRRGRPRKHAYGSAS